MDIVSMAASETKPESNSNVVEGQGSGKEKEQGSQLPEEVHNLSQSSEIVEKKKKPKKRKRNENPGGPKGKYCHQCHQKTMDIMAPCKNKKKDKQCTTKYCHKCLLNRYGVKAEEVWVVEDWFCPKCRDNCNCSCCRRIMGLEPTGILSPTAKSIGFSSVSEMLLVGFVNQPGKEPALSIQGKHGKNIASEDTNIDLDDQKGKKVREGNVLDGSYGRSNDGLNDKPYDTYNKAKIPLPEGSELKTVISNELQPEEVGHALQFLEFCTAFGEVIELEKDELRDIFRDVVCGGHVCEEKSSPVAHFIVQILSLIQSDLGEGSTMISHSLSHKNSWLRALHECLSKSKHISEQLKLDQFDGEAASYNSLNTIERLKLVNYVCDGVLCTSKARTFIEEQKLKFYENEKETKGKLVAAKQKEKQMKEQKREEIAQTVIEKNGIPPSISEHKAIVLKYKKQVAEVHDEMQQLKGMLCKEKQHCKAVRTKPILVDTEGRSFWRLKGFDDESNVLRQDVNHQLESESSEKWFTYEKQKDEMERYLSFRQAK